MHSHRRLPLPVLAVATAALAVTAACGFSDEGSSSEPKPSASASASGGGSAAPEPADGALVTYVTQVRAQSEEQMKRFEDVYRDFSITGEGDDTLVYDYTFRNAVAPAQVDAQRDTIRKTVEGVGDSILTEMQTAGVDDPKVRWVYRNPDGAELMSFEVP